MASSAPVQPRIVSLTHVKEDSPKPPAAAPKIAWYGGVVTTNRDDATEKFATRLMRKLARGGTLTAAQQTVVDTYKLSPAYQAALEREAAAVKIQSVHRGNAARTKLESRLSRKETSRKESLLSAAGSPRSPRSPWWPQNE